jgi:ATP-dependent RNA helicase RhlE
MSFKNLGLTEELVKAVSVKGYKNPTPIQKQAIPAVLSGIDVLGGAQTGTGKTAAFTLPILQILSEQKYKSSIPRVLILTPTRELAAQVGGSVKLYGKGLPFRSSVVFGGVNINAQKRELRRGADIVVATPGRLLDHAGQGSINLSQVKILVLDEADRMLDMGFINDIKRITKLLPKKRQNLLFSATYSAEIRELSKNLLNNPLQIETEARNTAAETVRQIVHPVEQARKKELLVQLINNEKWPQVLVFTRTKHGAYKLAKHLVVKGVNAAAIHGDKTQSARTKTLAEFKSGMTQILVATDIASRGLDINLLPFVVNYDLPYVPEDYIHRIGRTGRAGAEGIAVSFVSSGEKKLLNGIEKLLKRKLDVNVVPGFDSGPVNHTKKSDGIYKGGKRNKRRRRFKNRRVVTA